MLGPEKKTRQSDARNNAKNTESENVPGGENAIDALFQLPLSDFTVARNALAVRLKREGRLAESERVRALTKPSVSVWAVNQLYWKERGAFDRLLQAGQRLRETQSTQLSGKPADIRGALDARREAIAELVRSADTLLGAGGHGSAPETMRRIAATLEALSAQPESQLPGRLTADLDAPGFELLATLVPDAAFASTTRPKESESTDGAKDRISQARALLRDAEQARDLAQTKFEEASAAVHKAERSVEQAESQRRDAEERFEKAKALAGEAVQRARRMEAAWKAAEQSVTEARRAVGNSGTDP